MSQILVQFVLGNALFAAALAVIVWGAGFVLRRPAVLRAMWIIVLLKLLTPPLWTIPLPGLSASRPAAANVERAARPLAADTQALLTDAMPAGAPVEPSGIQAAVDPAVAVSRSFLHAILAVLPAIWLAGSAPLLAIGAARFVVLRRLLKRAVFASSDVQQQATELSQRLGIVQAPGVWFVSRVVCPALWAFARSPRVLIPVGLWSSLDYQQRRTLLAHELAHLRRRDHWVRLLEAVATVAYWWHPAVWIARREIHDFEEQCCDAWVLWALPTSARSYGTALLATVDFVSMYRPMRPALAAGLGEFRHLKRRLLMIKQGQVARALSRTSLLAIGGAAVMALAVGPVLGQAAPPGADEPSSTAPEEGTARADRAEVDEARAQIARLRAELAAAESRLAILEHGRTANSLPGRPPSAVGVMPGAGPGTGNVSSGTSIVTTPPFARTPAHNNRVSAGAGMSGMRSGGGGFGGGVASTQQPADIGAGGFGGGGSAGSTRSGVAFGRFSNTPEDRDQRLEILDRQLRQIMAELRELKRENAAQTQQRHSGGPDQADSPQPTPPANR